MNEAEKIADRLAKALDAGGPELTQCLLDLGLLTRAGNRVVRTVMGERALRQCNALQEPSNGR